MSMQDDAGDCNEDSSKQETTTEVFEWSVPVAAPTVAI
jgi:hypothetical protein